MHQAAKDYLGSDAEVTFHDIQNFELEVENATAGSAYEGLHMSHCLS